MRMNEGFVVNHKYSQSNPQFENSQFKSKNNKEF